MGTGRRTRSDEVSKSPSDLSRVRLVDLRSIHSCSLACGNMHTAAESARRERSPGVATTSQRFQWLTGFGVVNHHTLSDFRIEHRAALDEVFTQVLAVLSGERLITLERVMHDGTKIYANA